MVRGDRAQARIGFLKHMRPSSKDSVNPSRTGEEPKHMTTKTQDALWSDLATAWENFEHAPSHQTARALAEAIDAAR
jgi:hypothetical protein